MTKIEKLRRLYRICKEFEITTEELNHYYDILRVREDMVVLINDHPDESIECSMSKMVDSLCDSAIHECTDRYKENWESINSLGKELFKENWDRKFNSSNYIDIPKFK